MAMSDERCDRLQVKTSQHFRDGRHDRGGSDTRIHDKGLRILARGEDPAIRPEGLGRNHLKNHARTRFRHFRPMKV